MAHLFRDLSLGHSKRGTNAAATAAAASASVNATPMPAADLPSPFGQLSPTISDSDLRLTAYEIFVSACRTSSGKPLSSIAQAERSLTSSPTPIPTPPISPSLQRTLTSTAASRVKKAFGLKSSPSSKKSPSGKETSPAKAAKKPMTVGELMRCQMRVSEDTDSRIRRALLRIAASQVSLIRVYRISF